MDSGFITALCGGIAAIIGATALLLRQQRINGKAAERDRRFDRERVRLLYRMIEVLAAIQHDLRVELAGRQLPASIDKYEQQLKDLRDKLVILDTESSDPSKDGEQ